MSAVQTPLAGRTFMRAALLAPLAAPAAYVVGLFCTTAAGAALGRGSLPSSGAALQLLGGVLAVGIPLAYGAMLVVGVPVALVLWRSGTLARWPLWAAGGITGAAVARIMAPQFRGELFSIAFPWWTGALLGVVSAEAFWRLLRRGPTAPAAPIEAAR